MDVVGALTEKIGPLPGYAYVIVGVGGVLWYKKTHSTPKATVLPSNDGSTNLGISPSASPVDPASAYSQPVDNNAWALAAAQHLGTTSAFSPSDISTALSNYLAGAGLTSAQQNIVNAAIGANGYPSGGLIPVVSADVPTPTLQTATPTPQNLPYVAPPAPSYNPSPSFIPYTPPPAYTPPPDPVYTPPFNSYTPAPVQVAPTPAPYIAPTPTPVQPKAPVYVAAPTVHTGGSISAPTTAASGHGSIL